MEISNAIGATRRARVSGFALEKGNFSAITKNLEQKVAIIGQPNTSNATILDFIPKNITSAQQAGELYGFGSPIHSVARILFPVSGGGVQTEVTAYPLIEKAGSTATKITINVAGSALSNGTINMLINGREVLDFKSYDVNVKLGDTPEIIASKMVDAVNANISCPMNAVVDKNDAKVVIFSSKWNGESSSSCNIDFLYPSNDMGVTFGVISEIKGTGTPDLSTVLNSFGDKWEVLVINTLGVTVLDQYEQFNGTPYMLNPSGRYAGDIFKPFFALTGMTTDVIAEYELITDDQDRRNQVTNVICPAPNSKGLPYEAAANIALLAANRYTNMPHSDVNDFGFPDMPAPKDGVIGDMSDYKNRDMLVKLGCSTVVFKNGAYHIEDLITTYHPENAPILTFSYVRDLVIDFNMAYRYKELEDIYVKDKTIIDDDQITRVPNVIKPKEFTAILFDYFDEAAQDGLIVDVEFSKKSVLSKRSDTNPNRINSIMDYKRSGLVRISSTTVKVGY